MFTGETWSEITHVARKLWCLCHINQSTHLFGKKMITMYAKVNFRRAWVTVPIYSSVTYTTCIIREITDASKIPTHRAGGFFRNENESDSRAIITSSQKIGFTTTMFEVR